MTMPRTLTLVRHGESESNFVKREAEKGRPVASEAGIMDVHTSRRRLTNRGVQQARKAGEWLHAYFKAESRRLSKPAYEDLYGYFSPYARAAETAFNLDLPIEWKADARLCERNWGELDHLTSEERSAKYGETMRFREKHGIFWPAGNGETLQMLATRTWTHYDMLHRQHSNHDAIEVSHGETILVNRYMLEDWLPEDVVRMMLVTDTRYAKEVLGVETDWQNKLINCRIVQYTREREDGTWAKRYCRVRLIAPSTPDDVTKNLPWTNIERKTFTTKTLHEYVEQFPRLLIENAA